MTTARDIAIMSRALLQHPLIKEYSTIWMDSLRNGETELANTNKLLKSYSGTTGLKTGTTDGAGSCLSASAERNGMGLISVTMGSATSDERFASARALLDYGFGRWERVQPESIASQLTTVPVTGGVEMSVAVKETEIPSIILEKASAGEVTSKLTLEEKLEAPIALGQKAGVVDIYVGGNKMASYDIVTAAEIEEMTFGKALGILFKSLIGMA